MSDVTHVGPQDLTKKNSPMLPGRAAEPETGGQASQQLPYCYYNGQQFRVGSSICADHNIWVCSWKGTYGWISMNAHC
jgi:hypothetical protein